MNSPQLSAPQISETLTASLLKIKYVKTFANHEYSGLSCVEKYRKQHKLSDSLQGRGFALKKVRDVCLNSIRPSKSEEPDFNEDRWVDFLILDEQYVKGGSVESVRGRIKFDDYNLVDGGVPTSTYHTWRTRAINRFNECLEQLEAGLISDSEIAKLSPIKPSQPLRDLINLDAGTGDENVLSNLPREQLIKLIQKYSQELPPGTKGQIIRDVTSMAWRVVTFDSFFASKVKAECLKIGGELVHLLKPLWKIALNQPITSLDLDESLRLLQNNLFFPSDAGFIENELLILRILRHLLYDKSSDTNAHNANRLILQVIDKQGVFWRDAFIDMFFRFHCGYITLAPDAIKLIEQIAFRHFAETPDSLYSTLWPVISDPMKFCRSRTLAEVQNFLFEVSRQARTVFQAKWSVVAFMRLVPLYEQEEDEDLEFEKINEIFTEIDTDLIKKSSILQFIHLQGLLSKYLVKLDSKILVDYEKKFLEYHGTLFGVQVGHLQIEYACCLIEGLFAERSSQSGLMFYELLNSSTTLSSSLLFKNAYIEDFVFDVPNPVQPKSVYDWLRNYVKKLFYNFVKTQISTDYLSINRYTALQRQYFILEPLSFSLLEAINSQEDNQNQSIEQHAKSLVLAKYLPEEDKLRFIWSHLAHVRKGSPYLILRNATWIYKSLYTLFYYGDSIQRSNAKELLSVIQTAVSASDGEAKLFWAYLAGLTYEENPLEEAFILAFWHERKYQSLSDTSHLVEAENNKSQFSFSEIEIGLINNYAEKGSIFAQTLQNHLNHPEVWNTIGTTLYNIKRVASPFLEASAYFYLLAIVFAKSSRLYSQKFIYNHIRNQSFVYITATETPPYSFFKEVTRFLTRPGAITFFTKEKNVQPFFDCLNANMDKLSHSEKTFLFDKLSRVKWLAKRVSDFRFMEK